MDGGDVVGVWWGGIVGCEVVVLVVVLVRTAEDEDDLVER